MASKTPPPVGEPLGIGARIAAGLLNRRRSLSPSGAHAIVSDADYKELEGNSNGKSTPPSVARVAMADALSKSDNGDIEHLRSVLRSLDQPSKPATSASTATAVTPSSSSQSLSTVSGGDSNSANPGASGSGLPLSTQQFLHRINDSKGALQLPQSLSSHHQQQQQQQQQPFSTPGGATTALPSHSHVVDGGARQQVHDLICGDIYIPGAQRWAPGEVARTQHHYRSFRARSTFIRCKDVQSRYEVENLSLLVDLIIMNRTDVALEMAIRRIVGVEEADRKGDNWQLARYLNSNFAQPDTMGSDTLRKQAYKDMAAHRTAHSDNASNRRNNRNNKGGKNEKGKSKSKSGSSAGRPTTTSE